VKIMFGYRPAECGVVLGHGELPDASFRVTQIRPEFYNYTSRSSVRISLGCHVLGTSLPVPDFNHGPSQLAGCTKRVAAAMPPIPPNLGRRFFRWVKRFCNKHLRFLKFSPTDDFDFESWITNTEYPLYRKQELREVYELSKNRRVKFDVKAFIKDEDYTDYKHLRGIYSRCDDYKVRVGPYFQKFGDKLFSSKWFIKKIPVPERPTALLEKLGKYNNIFCTDFSQYESTFVDFLMRVEHWIYRWSLEGHPLQKHFCDLFALMRQSNKIVFKLFDCVLDAKRMSGEMNTSCGNGLMNLLITFFNLERAGNDIEKCDAFFEGDDGIVGCVNIPTSQLYTDLGARIKIDIPEGISTASFCGNVFHPDHLHNVTNPSEASVSFGWTRARNYRFASHSLKMRLLCAKSISMLYEYPGCPILKHLGQYGLRCTYKYIKSLDAEFVRRHSDNVYHAEQVQKAREFIQEYGIPNVEIGDGTRSLVERLYGISVSAQLYIEHKLDSLSTLQPLDFSDLLNCPKCWYDNDFNYTVEVDSRIGDPVFSRHGFTTLAYFSPALLRVFNH